MDSAMLSPHAVCLYGSRKSRSTSDPGAISPRPYPPVATSAICSEVGRVLRAVKVPRGRIIVDELDQLVLELGERRGAGAAVAGAQQQAPALPPRVLFQLLQPAEHARLSLGARDLAPIRRQLLAKGGRVEKGRGGEVDLIHCVCLCRFSLNLQHCEASAYRDVVPARCARNAALFTSLRRGASLTFHSPCHVAFSTRRFAKNDGFFSIILIIGESALRKRWRRFFRLSHCFLVCILWDSQARTRLQKMPPQPKARFSG